MRTRVRFEALQGILDSPLMVDEEHFECDDSHYDCKAAWTRNRPGPCDCGADVRNQERARLRTVIEKALHG